MKKLSLITFCFALGCALLAVSARAEDTTAVAKTPEIDHMVYLSFLPTPEELMADAKTSGLAVVRLDKTADRVVITYKYPDGHVATLGYALLGSARNSDRVTDSRPMVTERTVVSTERDPEIVYVERDRPYTTTRVVYRDSYDNFWPPLVLGLGLGWATSWHGSGHYYHGGYSRGYHGGGRHH